MNNTDNDLQKEQAELEKQKLVLERLKIEREIEAAKFNNQRKENITKNSSKLVQKIFVSSLIGITLSCLSIIFLILLVWSINPQNIKGSLESNSADISVGINLIIFAVIFVFLSVISFILSLICSIQILVSNFGHKEINDMKILWGILGLLVIGSIASLVFSVKAKRIINDYQNSQK